MLKAKVVLPDGVKVSTDEGHDGFVLERTSAPVKKIVPLAGQG
jgi:hypothetical protein